MRKGTLSAGACATLASWAALVSCSHPKAASVASANPTVSVASVTRGDVAQKLTISAEFLPYQEIDVHAKVAGYVKSIDVDVGDRVAAGQVLAVLEVPELEDEIAQDDATARRSAASINRARADLVGSQSLHDVAHVASTRLAGVMKQQANLVAQQDIDEAVGRDRATEAQVETAQAAVAEAEQQLAVAKATQARTKTMFAYAQITAPFSGVITHRYADTGAMIQAGTSSQTQSMPVVKLSQNSTLRLLIQVPESAVPRIHLGQDVEVRVEAMDRALSGRIARFAGKVDPDTRTMETEVDIPNPKGDLMPGMYADAVIVLAAARDVLVVPIDAVDRQESGHASVAVVTSNQTLAMRDVVLGLDSPDHVEVKSGLRENEQVVVGNHAQFTEGEQVVSKRADAPSSGGSTR